MKMGRFDFLASAAWFSPWISRVRFSNSRFTFMLNTIELQKTFVNQFSLDKNCLTLYDVDCE